MDAGGPELEHQTSECVQLPLFLGYKATAYISWYKQVTPSLDYLPLWLQLVSTRPPSSIAHGSLLKHSVPPVQYV